MNDSSPPRWPAETARAEAERLAASVTSGAALPELSSPVLLDVDEILHASVQVSGWRNHALDVVVEQRRLLAIGGPVVFGLTAAASTIGNRRARVEAERLAAPQWRPLGNLPILATNKRLLAFHEGQWASVWFAAIRQIIPDVDRCSLELVFEDDPPYALCGEWVPYLTVVLTTVLADQRGIAAVDSAIRSA